MTNKTRVLILCTGNSCRSQMAEAFFRHHAGDTVDAYSAGLDPRPIHEMAVTVMDEVGIDIRGQRPKSVSEFLGKQSFDHVIFVCESAERNCPHIYPFIRERMLWPFTDPASAEGSMEERLETFRRVRDAIEKRIIEWIPTTKGVKR